MSSSPTLEAALYDTLDALLGIEKKYKLGPSHIHLILDIIKHMAEHIFLGLEKAEQTVVDEAELESAIRRLFTK